MMMMMKIIPARESSVFIYNLKVWSVAARYIIEFFLTVKDLICGWVHVIPLNDKIAITGPTQVGYFHLNLTLIFVKGALLL